jgi:hypothetical protein
LRRRQERFLIEYLKCWDGTRAALAAGYAPKSARISASKNLANPEIKAEIDRRLSEESMQASEIVQRLTRQARGNMRQFYKLSERWTEWPLPTQEIIDERTETDDSGKLHTLYLVRSIVFDVDALLDDGRAELIQSITDSPKNGLTVVMYSAKDALALLGKHRRLFADVLQQEIKLNIEGLEDLRKKIYGDDTGND